RAAEPVRAGRGYQVEVDGNPVDHTESRVEHPLPGERGEDGGNDPGEEQGRPHEPLQREDLIQEQGHREPQGELENRSHARVEEGVPEAGPERVVDLELEVVVPEADEVAGVGELRAGDRQPEAEEEG